MASYLDNIPTFNEYVEQRPLDDMLKAGVFKQQRFEEGVTKIQNSIDNIAGLDVVRGIDKEYLQSKLNALGGQLSNFAASDFSNFQLVNSLNGMTNQVAKDPIVLGAVASSSAYRKQLENMQKIDTDGKGSESNKFIFNEQVNQWLNGDLQTQFNAQYKPYVDYNKQAQTIVKNLAKDSTTNDVAFQYDSNGNIVGILDAITRTKIEGITPEKIQSALMAGLPQDAWQQMSNDGRYRYANISDEQFANDINNSYTATFNEILAQRNELEAKLGVASSGPVKSQLQNQIKALDAEAERLRAEYNDVSSSFGSGDVESAKARLYTTDWMKTFSNSFSSRNVSQTYETNPFKTVQLAQAKLAEDQRQFNERMLLQQQNHNERMEIEQKKLELMSGYGGISLGLEDPEEQSDTDVIAKYETYVDEGEKSLNAKKNEIISRYQGITADNFDEMYSMFLQTNGANFQFDSRGDFSEYADLQRTNVRNQNVYDGLLREAEELYGFKGEDDAANRSFSLGGYGYDFLYAQEKYSEFDKKYAKYKRGGDISLGGIYVDEYGIMRARGELSDKDYKLFELWAAGKGDRTSMAQWADQFDTLYGDGGRNSGDYYEALDEDIVNYRSSIRQQYNLSSSQKNKYIADLLRKGSFGSQRVSYEVPLTNTAQINTFKSVVMGLADEDAARDGADKDEVLKVANDLSAARLITNGSEYSLVVMGDAGLGKSPNSVTLKLSPVQYQEIFGGRFDKPAPIAAFEERYLPTMLDTRMELKKNPNSPSGYSRDAQSYWSTSTDMKYETSIANAGLAGPTDFPNVQYYGVSGNIISDSNPKSAQRFKLSLNIFDPVSGELYQGLLFPTEIARDKIVPTIMQLTDEYIHQLLYGKSMSQEDMRNLINASQQF